MIPAEQTQIHLVSKPQGALSESHFEVSHGPVAEPGDGEVVVRTVMLSIDAANRAWMEGPTYRAQVMPGDVMHAAGVGEVVASQSPRLKVGDIVMGMLGWQEYATVPAKEVGRCPNHRPLSHLLSVLGIAGKTAYHGLVHVGQIREGETLLVSAAAGSVGSIVGQIGKILGAHVIGVAGGPAKCQWVVDTLGFDACIDYKNDDVGAKLKELAPKGVDVYFDNVGGPILQAALLAMNPFGRIACCGSVSEYDTKRPAPIVGIPGLLVVRRIRMEGFIVLDFADRDEVALRDLSAWASDGRLQVAEDIVDGLENAPAALIGLLAGDNRGKRMVRVGADPA